MLLVREIIKFHNYYPWFPPLPFLSHSVATIDLDGLGIFDFKDDFQLSCGSPQLRFRLLFLPDCKIVNCPSLTSLEGGRWKGAVWVNLNYMSHLAPTAQSYRAETRLCIMIMS